ncbi:MAG: hypothetical protein WBG71_14315 [Leeuwenhoekiella sp.]
MSFLVIYLPKFPRTTNHGNLEIFIAIFLIALITLSHQKFKRGELNAGMINWTFRVTLVSIYFVAGFHKLNSGFLSLENSCVVTVPNHLHSLIFGTESHNWIFIRLQQLVTITVEMIVPLGLLFYRTRKFSAWVLVLFHFYLSLCDFSNFSALAGFLIIGSLLDYTARIPKHLQLAFRIYVLLSIAAVVMSYGLSRFSLAASVNIRFYNGIIFNVGWCYLFYCVLTNYNIRKQTETLYYCPLLIASLCVFLWGGQAYLGLTNAGNLTMFSNLMTVKSKSNHLLINTDYTKIWGFEEDTVFIKKLPEGFKWENSMRLEGYSLPRIEFAVQIQNWMDQSITSIPCTLVYKEKTFVIDDLRKSKFAHTKFWYPLIHFRRIPKSENMPCFW